MCRPWVDHEVEDADGDGDDNGDDDGDDDGDGDGDGDDDDDGDCDDNDDECLQEVVEQGEESNEEDKEVEDAKARGGTTSFITARPFKIFWTNLDRRYSEECVFGAVLKIQ